MATFNIAFERTMGHEGAYSNDPDDKGGETCWGIARNYHPRWNGWGRVEGLKAANPDPAKLKRALSENGLLLKAVKDFYKEKFWDKVKGDGVPSQEVANEVFDTAVNMGTKRAIEFLQECLNKFNRDERDDYYKDMKVDGIIGNITLSNLKTYLSRDDELLLVTSLNSLQGAWLIENGSEKFIRGWIKHRVKI